MNIQEYALSLADPDEDTLDIIYKDFEFAKSVHSVWVAMLPFLKMEEAHRVVLRIQSCDKTVHFIANGYRPNFKVIYTQLRDSGQHKDAAIYVYHERNPSKYFEDAMVGLEVCADVFDMSMRNWEF